MERTNFEKLRVYKLPEDLADEVWNMVLKWDSLARDTVGKQIVKSADSVGANIAEGCGRGSYQDNRRFIRNSRGSLNETQHWLRRAYRRKLLTSADVGRIKPLVDKLAPQLNAYLKSIGTHLKKPQRSMRALGPDDRQPTTDNRQPTTDD